MFTLKAYRGPSTFEQNFTSHDAYIEKRNWLIANGFTIGSIDDMHTRAHVRNELIFGMH
jgi:hypothetical protein